MTMQVVTAYEAHVTDMLHALCNCHVALSALASDMSVSFSHAGQVN
jgi:hypothetical protein